MVTASASAALQRFVDDELMRAPLLVDQVIEGAVEHIRKAIPGMVPHDRTVASDLLQNVLALRQPMLDRYIASLREQLAAESRPAPAGAPAPAAPEPRLSLSLVDEDEVAVDVEISHTIEAIRSIAEYELRELQTFTAALVGDMDVTRDHNPFRPETHARALWAASQALPMSRGYQLTFMRHACMALAQLLRKTFAGASSRLEAAGIEPASHRTLILPSGSRRSRPSEASFSPDLQNIRDKMPVRERPAAPHLPLEQVLAQTDAQLRNLPVDGGFTEHDRLRERLREQLVDSAATAVDQQLVELLSRLFDAILSDRALASDIRFLLSRLQAPTLRIALRDPRTLDKEIHPIWQLADRVAFYGEILPAGSDKTRGRVLRYVQGLLDHLVAEPEQNSALVQWVIERLQIYEQQRLEQRCASVAHEIADLQQLEDRLSASPEPPTTMHGAIDVAQLETVPAELIDAEPARKQPAANARGWLEQQRPGHWVRMFMQGRWVHAQVLWPGERGEVWLFGDAASSTTWAVRRRALLTLHGENLLDSLEPRSLVRDAAKRVMRQTVR